MQSNHLTQRVLIAASQQITCQVPFDVRTVPGRGVQFVCMVPNSLECIVDALNIDSPGTLDQGLTALEGCNPGVCAERDASQLDPGWGTLQHVYSVRTLCLPCSIGSIHS